MFEVCRTTAVLSPEGKRERLSHLLASGKVWLSFVVDGSIRVFENEAAPQVFNMFG